MIRQTLVFCVVFFLAVYAWKDWFKSLCGLVVLMAVVQHPDMPRNLMGIQGLNPWNLLCLIVLLAWSARRPEEGLAWDMPGYINVLLLLYLGVVCVGFWRMMTDRTGLEDTAASLVSEYLINTIKWVVPGLLLFDGCRSRERFNLALYSVLAVYLLLGLQVIRWMPPSYLTHGESLSHRSLKILLKEVGYHRVNLSMMLAGASWAFVAARTLATRPLPRAALLGMGLVTLYAQALTGGRMGYATWAIVGIVLCGLRWRRYLLVAPAALALIAWAVPGAVERMEQGFAKADAAEAEEATVSRQLDVERDAEVDVGDVNEYQVTSGRNVIWPYVVERIMESPVVGYGRQAMRRTGLEDFLLQELGESFPHPHNAYLEMLLDNGWVGFCLVVPFYLVVLVKAMALFCDGRSTVFVAIGGVTCALVLALLVAAFGSQTFYPREGAVGMWCAIGLMFRVSIERQRALARARETAVRSMASARAPELLAARGVARGAMPVAAGSIDGGLWA